MIQNLKTVLALLKPYRRRVNLAIITGILAGALTGGGFSKGAELLFAEIFSEQRDLPTQSVALVALVFPVLFTLVGASTFCSAYLLNHSGLSAIRALRCQLFSHLQQLPLAFFQTRKTGDLISRMTSDAQMLQHTLSMVARDLVIQPASLIGGVAYLAYKAFEQEGVVYIYICLAALPFVVFPIRYFSRKIQKKARSQQEEIGQLTNSLAQNLAAAREVRAFNLQQRETAAFDARASLLFKAQMKVVKYSQSLSPTVEFISSIGLSVAFVVGYRNGVPGEDFLGIFIALYLSYTPLKRIGRFSGELYQGTAALRRIQEIISTPVDIADPAQPLPLRPAAGHIEFRDVSFAYGDTPALSHISATIPSGATCALVGPSGAGKSTFANLVPRFYDVTSGAILLDGQDIRQFRVQDLREQIALVSQEPVLFDDTILENIRLGRQGATDDEVKEAARQAFADDFVSDPATCPRGYQTIVGERGVRLSGGQKQRIAIARAFLRQAPILILDEATSALDSESEAKIQQALGRLVEGKTVLIIAHRFSTIKNANQILVFENGAIIDSGSHPDLYPRCPLYKKLYDQQQHLHTH